MEAKTTTVYQIRALDHAIELLYHPLAPEIPTKRLALTAIADFFNYLPLSASGTSSADTRQILFLAAYTSLFPFLSTGRVLFTGGSGLSHSIGNSIGTKYNIPHGITSCLTLAAVVHLKAETKLDEARQIARAVEAVGRSRTGDTVGDARAVGDAIAELVGSLGHTGTLTEV
jgi:alcohol dehydrogenase class IV